MTLLERTLELVCDRARFEGLRRDWNALAEIRPTPLSLHEWYLAALDARGDAIQLRTFLIWDGDRLVAAAPLGKVRRGFSHRLVPLDAFAGEPDQLLFVDELALELLVKAIAADGQAPIFRRLRAGSIELDALSAAHREGAFLLRRLRGRGAEVDLSNGFETLEAQMSANRRSQIRRKFNAATRALGAPVLDHVIPHPLEITHLLERFQHIEGSGWKARSGTSLSKDQRMQQFVESLCRRFAVNEKLHFIFLRFGEHDAAARIIIECAGAWFEVKIGYNEEHAKYSPGILHMHHTMRRCCELGVSRYAFLGSYEEWQNHWPTSCHQYEYFSAFPIRPRSLLALASDVLNRSD